MKLKRVYLEISNRCNLRCSFCTDCHRSPRDLSLDEIEHILPQIKQISDYIYLHVKGEPLLHPLFNQILDRMEYYQLQVQLVSNGTYLKDHFDLLNRGCLRKISFSLHSIPYQPLSVEEYMQPLIDFANQASLQKHPYCEFRFWNQDHWDEQSKNCLNRLLNEATLTRTKKIDSFFWKEGVFVHFDQQFEWPQQAHSDDTVGFCHGGHHMIGILSNGTVVPCCLDDRGTVALGNIFTESLNDILSNSRYQALVQGFRQRKVIEPLCQKCSYRHRFD